MNPEKQNPDEWRTPPTMPSITPGEIHVWRIDLALPDAEIDFHLGHLSADECDRANRFIFKQDRERFIAARGMLRQTLGRYLRIAPADLRFGYASHGKPFIKHEGKTQDLRFNLSHSADVALLAIAVACEVGIDVEQIREDFPFQEIARQFFTDAEYGRLCAMDPTLRCATFFKYWTHKEAFIKASGEGLSYPLNQFEISLQPELPTKLSSATRLLPRHSLHTLTPCVGYAGALAVLGEFTRVDLWAG